MDNPFDRALSSVQDEDARRRAQQEADRAASTAREEQQRQRLRPIVDPYLRQTAAAASRALRQSGITPLSTWPVHNPRTDSGTGIRREDRWNLSTSTGPGSNSFPSGSYAGSVHLYLTADGHFTQSHSLPGPQGYEELLARVRWIPPQPKESSVDYYGPVFVEEVTNRVCVAASFIHSGRMELRDVRVWGIRRVRRPAGL